MSDTAGVQACGQWRVRGESGLCCAALRWQMAMMERRLWGQWQRDGWVSGGGGSTKERAGETSFA